MEDILRYPIGKFLPKEEYTKNELEQFIGRIESLPSKLEREVGNLTSSQLDTPYRDGGWTVRQVIHHMADSHLNAYIRFKWTLTEETPMIKAYNEKAWAETVEMKANPNLSIALLKALHAKWIVLLRGHTATDLKKEFIHPETKKHIRLENLMGMYAWHGEHHLAHITALKVRMGW
jgi:hypothetical protein